MVDDNAELNELRDRVNCCTVLEEAKWRLDEAESSQQCPKYRDEGSGIIIVRHAGRGWFEPNAGVKGDVIKLAQYLWQLNIGQVRRRLRPLAGIEPQRLPLTRTKPRTMPLDVLTEWKRGRSLKPGSQGWQYLVADRGLPGDTLRRAATAGSLCEGVYGTVWALHTDAEGRPIGWEMRGPRFQGYLRDGRKGLFQVGAEIAHRLVITEAFIDALSLATLEGWQADTRYASTGGGWTPTADTMIEQHLVQGGSLVSAVDRGVGGNIMTARLLTTAKSFDAEGRFTRLAPMAKDWNEELRPLAIMP
jgi:hypothetical protein